ncbi:MgtC/SapB family protein [Thalassospira mesophila]|uniref:Protein MgtC n=1 Tax=Thalassospira mesophila TaxID=1293891 RepID=A0A1Y2L482_9PROT|nr:MgtC/SapB family protein [Thalassospira mesophila]OSQ40350.1 magnesium transporter [Thalassospira mesophila]
MFELPYFATASQYFDIELIDVILRLLAATVIGMMIGLNRDINDKPTGMRTLALVSLGAAVVSVVAVHFEGLIDNPDALSRVVQGILQGVLTGIGFIGAGVIMRQPKDKTVTGLTTAATVWITAALGIACALAAWQIVLVASVLTFFVLVVLKPVELFLVRLFGGDPEAVKEDD